MGGAKTQPGRIAPSASEISRLLTRVYLSKSPYRIFGNVNGGRKPVLVSDVSCSPLPRLPFREGR
jgi:hypothetical protein